MNEISTRITTPTTGAVWIFIGVIRPLSPGNKARVVEYLVYDAYDKNGKVENYCYCGGNQRTLAKD